MKIAKKEYHSKLLFSSGNYYSLVSFFFYLLLFNRKRFQTAKEVFMFNGKNFEVIAAVDV